jgi:glycine/D-amino acid oxidase-like deaminating enzyme
MMTAQRPGTRLPTDTTGGRSHVFYYPTSGFDYLTRLPKREGKDGGGELLFGGGAVQDGRLVVSEFGVADDSGHHLGIASHIQGALPEYFGLENWGSESVDAPREVKEEDSAWSQGRVSGEGMTHAWLCAHALALMVLGLENEEGVHTWFPDEYRLTEKRRKKATIEQLMAMF